MGKLLQKPITIISPSVVFKYNFTKKRISPLPSKPNLSKHVSFRLL